MVTPTPGFRPTPPPMADIEPTAMRKIESYLKGIIQSVQHEDSPTAVKEIRELVTELKGFALNHKVKTVVSELEAAATKLEKIKVPSKDPGPAAAPMGKATVKQDITPIQVTENKALIGEALAHLEKAESGLLASENF